MVSLMFYAAVFYQKPHPGGVTSQSDSYIGILLTTDSKR